MTATLTAWQARMDSMLAETERLKQEGLWKSGPETVLSIINRGRRETFHCRLIAWLLKPAMPHGLGDRFLREFLGAIELLDAEVEAALDRGDIRVACEVVRARSRADILIEAAGFQVVVEAKVDHFERERQCEDLYQDYCDHPETYFIFLSPEGRAPESVSDACAEEFVALSFGNIRECLEAAVRKTEETPSSAALDYLNTLREVFPVTDKVMDDQLVFYLKHKKAIREWARLEERERDAADSFFLSLQDDFAALAERLGVELWSNDPEHSSPAYRFYRQNWAKAREKPLVCVAFEYYRPKAAFDSPWTGIWFFEDWEKRDPVWQDELERIKTVLADTSTRLGIELPKRGRWRWWAVTHHTTPPAGYWKEEGMPKLRQHLLAEMRGTWEKYADLIDSVMGSS